MTIRFSEAIEELRKGKKVSRYSWDNNTFVYLVLGSNFLVNREPLLTLLPEGTPVTYMPHIDKMKVYGKPGEERFQCISEVWSPTTEEMLACNWRVHPED